MTTTPKGRLTSFCWRSMFASIVDEDVAHVAGMFQERAVLDTRQTKTFQRLRHHGASPPLLRASCNPGLGIQLLRDAGLQDSLTVQPFPLGVLVMRRVRNLICAD
jgi:hypothetical protein